MQTITFSIRLNRADYDHLKRHAKIHQKPMNKLITEMVSGSLCLSPHHDLLNFNTQKTACKYDNSSFDNLQFTYETLLLLREMVKLQHPELVNLATSKRLAYFDPQKNKDRGEA